MPKLQSRSNTRVGRAPSIKWKGWRAKALPAISLLNQKPLYVGQLVSYLVSLGNKESTALQIIAWMSFRHIAAYDSTTQQWHLTGFEDMSSDDDEPKYDPTELAKTDSKTIKRWLDDIKTNARVGSARGGITLTEWEVSFYESVETQFQRTGSLSGKQLVKLREIWDRC